MEWRPRDLSLCYSCCKSFENEEMTMVIGVKPCKNYTAWDIGIDWE